jgi:hypothetical protein
VRFKCHSYFELPLPTSTGCTPTSCCVCSNSLITARRRSALARSPILRPAIHYAMRFRASVENVPTFFSEVPNHSTTLHFLPKHVLQKSSNPSRSYRRNASSSLRRRICTSSATATRMRAGFRSGRESQAFTPLKVGT